MSSSSSIRPVPGCRLAAVICTTLFGFCTLFAAENQPAPLVAGVSIEIPNSKGKFDFLEVDPGRHRLLGAHEVDGTVDVIDLDNNKIVARVQIGGAPVDVAVDPKTDKYFVSAQEGNRVAVVSAKTLKETNSIKMAGDLDGILFNPKNRCVYVANDEGKHIWVINADTEKLVGDIAIPGAPEYMVYDEANDRIYLNIKVTDEIVAIDPAKGVVVAHWPMSPATKPHGLAFDPKTGRLFAAGANSCLVTVDTKTGKVISNVEIAEKVDQATFDPHTRRIYCAAPGWMSVVQETETGTEFLGNVKTADTAKNVKVDPKTHAVWTTYTDGKNSYARSWLPVK